MSSDHNQTGNPSDPWRLETRIQRGRKSASNSGLSGSRNLQSGPSLPRDASLHGRPSNPNSSSTDRGATSGHRLALQGDNKTGSISHSAPIGKAFKSIGTRLGSGRSGSTDGGSDNRRQPTNIATKSIYPSRPASALKSVSRRGLEGNSQSLSTPSRLRFMQVGLLDLSIPWFSHCQLAKVFQSSAVLSFFRFNNDSHPGPPR